MNWCGGNSENWDSLQVRAPWTARRSNQSILKEINSEHSLEGLMMKLKFPYFDHLWEEVTHWKLSWCWERLKAKGKEDGWGWDDRLQHWLNGHEFKQTPGDNGGQRSLVCCSPWSLQRVAHDLVTEQDNNGNQGRWESEIGLFFLRWELITNID